MIKVNQNMFVTCSKLTRITKIILEDFARNIKLALFLVFVLFFLTLNSFYFLDYLVVKYLLKFVSSLPTL